MRMFTFVREKRVWIAIKFVTQLNIENIPSYIDYKSCRQIDDLNMTGRTFFLALKLASR